MRNDFESNYLMHHGILGMKWGVRRYQNPDGTLTALGRERLGYDGTRIKDSKEVLKKYKTGGIVPNNAQAQNLDKWGKSGKTNVLYISGTSGSGKSTVANKLKDKNVEIIHLDSYFDNADGPKCKDFDAYLQNKKSDYQKIQLPKEKISINNWGKVVERFERDIEEYGEDAFKRDKKVVVEGVHLLDDTIRPDKTYFNDKPFIMLNTNTLVSTIRANQRDEKKFSFNDVKDRMAWNKDIKNVKKLNSFHHNDFETGYLMHWGLKKGAKAPNHKYYERVEKNGKYLYFYTQAEYEAWLHQGNSALETAKEKGKGKGLLDKAKDKLGSLAKDSNSKQTLANTKQNLVNAVNTGYSQTTNLLAMAQKQLTKSNAQQVIDRGNKAISSILNTTPNTVSNVSKQAQNSLKATSANAQNKAKSIASQVERTIKQAGKDTSKVVNSYISKGEKAIKQTLSKASNMTVSQASKQHGDRGAGIIGPILATVAAALVIRAVAKLVKAVVTEVKDRRDYNKQVEQKKKEREEAINKKVDPKEKTKAQERMNEFSNDAKDSYKENLVEHTDIPQKDTATSADEDMMAVNKQVSENEIYQQYEQKAQEFEELYERYLETGDIKDLKAAQKLQEEALELYYHNAGFLNNCANCTLTYDLRRRGYDVDAPWNDFGTSDFTITNWYNLDPERDVEYWNADDQKRFSKQEAKDMVDYMNNQYPDGAYGHFCITWSEGGGHDCVWSKEGGKIIIRDCQTGQVLDPEEYILKANDIYYFRADDKELSDAAYKIANADQTNTFGEDVSDGKENDTAQWYDDYWYYKRRKEYERY